MSLFSVDFQNSSKEIHLKIPTSDTIRGIFIGDLHLSVTDKYGSRTTKGYSSRTQDKLDILSNLFKYMLEGPHPDIVIFGGDIFHKLNPPEKLRDAFIQVLVPLIKNQVPIYILVGNHDTDLQHYNLMSENNLISSLGSSSLHLVKSPLSLNLKGLDLLMIPWSDNDQSIQEVLSKAPPSLVFGHFGIVGARASGSEFQFSEGVSMSSFSHHHHLLMAHYHRPQSTDTYTYAGSIEAVDSSEAGFHKRVMWFKANGNTLEIGPLSITTRPFIVEEIEEGKALSPQALKLRNLEVDKEAIVKISVKGSKKWIHDQGYLDLIKKLKDKVSYLDYSISAIKEEIDTKSLDLVSGKTYLEIIKDYASSKGFSASLTEKGIELYSKAQDVASRRN